MLIEILGSGCSNCAKLASHAQEAAAKLGIEATIKKVTDFGEIASRGVMSTPGFAVNGQILATGRVLSVDQIQRLLQDK